MTPTKWFTLKWLWQVMTVAVLALSWRAQAELRVEPEQRTRADRQSA